jgi:hypothetical protein
LDFKRRFCGAASAKVRLSVIDRFSSLIDFGRPGEVGVGRRNVVEALVIAAMTVMFYEGLDLAFKIARKQVVLQHCPSSRQLAQSGGISGEPASFVG